MYFHNSLIPRGTYFLLPLESKQEATSGRNFTKCISEVKINQLKVKNMNVRMGISTFKSHINAILEALQMTDYLPIKHHLQLYTLSHSSQSQNCRSFEKPSLFWPYACMQHLYDGLVKVLIASLSWTH